MPNLIYQNPETTIWFVPAGATQAEDHILELDGLASGAGIQSAHWDRGVAAMPALYEWAMFVQYAAQPVLAETISIYLKPSGTSASATAHPANDDGTGAGAVSAIDKLNNLHLIGVLSVDEAAVDIEMVARGVTYLTARGYNVVIWNDSADALTTDENENGFYMTPIPDELQ